MNYIELEVEFEQLYPGRDVLQAELLLLGFDSFVETKTGLQSYIGEKDFDESKLARINEIPGYKSSDWKVIEDQNWNATWEQNFDPVFVENKLVIRAPFHTESFSQKMEVIIQPQMSFGTGHHQTTWLISKHLFELELKHKSVLDMGTGTGVLAIIAEKLGAKSIFAPDIDEWSYNNAIENCELNNCKSIEIAHGGHETVGERTFELVIANINKNILIQHFSVYSKALKPKGKLLISGFFATDAQDLATEAAKHGFIFEDTFIKDEWAMMQFGN